MVNLPYETLDLRFCHFFEILPDPFFLLNDVPLAWRVRISKIVDLEQPESVKCFIVSDFGLFLRL